MGRHSKHPEHQKEAERLTNELLDGVVEMWTAQKTPGLTASAEETEISPAKLRKLLITAGERDGKNYYDSPVKDQILELIRQGCTISDIQEITGLSYSSVQGYLPYSKTVYSLEELSTEAERIKLFRTRQAAIAALHGHLNLPEESEYLWKCVIAFEGYVFSTFGRGKERKGATRFRYAVSRSVGAGGRHYAGVNVEGFGNEIFVEGKKKSISRSTMDLALKKTKEVGGKVKGPKAPGFPGSGSYLYPMLVRFKLIEVE